jgi:hypothetical protein
MSSWDAVSETWDSESESYFSSIPPTYTIDLSLPPAKRFVEVALAFKLILEDLTKVFDELMEGFSLPKRPIHFASRLLMRKVYSREQTEELRGISEALNVPMYLLVAYNVLLDSFMGCTSGGVRVRDPVIKEKKMLHFRTLDWGMPELRKALVQFDYKQTPDGPVIASTISYVGYVGVLTGVRPGLSVSLNFRPYHNDGGSLWSNAKFYYHILRVIVGGRPSISSHLRDLLLPTDTDCKDSKSNPSVTPHCTDLAAIAEKIPAVSTTAVYLIFCDGQQTLILEKDRVTAKPIISPSFAAVTNHDVSYEDPSEGDEQSAQSAHAAEAKAGKPSIFAIGIEEMINESVERKKCIAEKWEQRCRRFGAKARENGNAGVWVSLEKLKEWISEYPVTNEETHFATIMDPTEGKIAWVMAYEEGEIERLSEA